MPWLWERWHSRESHDSQNPSFPRKRESSDLCDRKAGIGRMALDCHFPIGLGDKLRGNDGGAVDSRFRGNDRWAGMAEGGDDGRMKRPCSPGPGLSHLGESLCMYG